MTNKDTIQLLANYDPEIIISLIDACYDKGYNTHDPNDRRYKEGMPSFSEEWANSDWDRDFFSLYLSEIEEATNKVNIGKSNDFAILKDVVKFLDKRCKEQQTRVNSAYKSFAQFGLFDDCGSEYREDVIIAEAMLKAYVNDKVSIEKYYKKLKHEAEESHD